MAQAIWQYGELSTQEFEGTGEGEPAAAASAFRPDVGQVDPDLCCTGSDGRLGIDPVEQFWPKQSEPLSPSHRRRCINHLRQEFGVSERRACRTLGQHRSM